MMNEEDHGDEGHPKTTHITIPAAYSSGITLFALRDSAVGQELIGAPELPLLWFESAPPCIVTGLVSLPSVLCL